MGDWIRGCCSPVLMSRPTPSKRIRAAPSSRESSATSSNGTTSRSTATSPPSRLSRSPHPSTRLPRGKTLAANRSDQLLQILLAQSEGFLSDSVLVSDRQIRLLHRPPVRGYRHRPWIPRLPWGRGGVTFSAAWDRGRIELRGESEILRYQIAFCSSAYRGIQAAKYDEYENKRVNAPHAGALHRA